MILKNYFIKRKIDELLSSSCRNRRFLPFDRIGRILLFYNISDAEAAEICAGKLRKQGKEVYTCGYKSEGSPDSADDTHIYVGSRADTGKNGVPSDAVVQRLDACRADAIIDLTRGNSYVMQYLLLKCRCDFKAGVKGNENNLYDLTLAATDNKDLVYLFDQIVFYLQTIRSK